MIPIARLDEDGVTYTHPVLEFADEVALLVFAGALLYLAGSVAVQLARRSGPEFEEATRAE